MLIRIFSGAPEAHRLGPKFSDLRLSVKQNVDIWSLGCVFSVVATWITHGWKKVEEYQHQRRQEVARKLRQEDGDLFHDGEDPLEAVHSSHENVKLSARRNDFITVKVLDIVIAEMLKKHQYQLSAMQLCGKAEMVISQARAELVSYLAPSPDRESKTWTGSPILGVPSPLNFDPQRRLSVLPQCDQSENNGIIDGRNSPHSDEHHHTKPSSEATHAVVQSNGKSQDLEEPPSISVAHVRRWRAEKKWKLNAALPEKELLEGLRDRDNACSPM